MHWEILGPKLLELFRAHSTAGIAIVVTLSVVAFAKPKLVFKGMILAGIAVTLFYVLSLLGDALESGVKQKDEMYKKSLTAPE